MQVTQTANDSEHAHPALGVEWQVAPLFSLALAQNAVPLIQSVTLTNPTTCPLRDLTLELSVEPDLVACKRLPLGVELDANDTITVGPLDFTVNARALLGIQEREPVSLMWRLSHGVATLACGEVPFVLQPYDHWPHSQAWPGLLGAFVLPNDPVVRSLVRQVSDHMLRQGLNHALEGYQSRDRARVRQLAIACYETLETRGFSYLSSPPSFEPTGQKVRLPDVLWRDRMGCCLDLAVLNAAMLEQMGLNPLLFLLDGHALIGVWLEDDGFPEGVIHALPRVRNEIALERLLVWDITAATATRAQGFESACKSALQQLQQADTFDSVLDVAVLRRVPIRPLALRNPSALAAAPDDMPVTTDERVLTTPVAAEESSAPPADVQDALAARFTRWQEQLLDLGLRNRLLNVTLGAKSTLPLAVPEPVVLLRHLLQNQAEFLIQPAARGLAVTQASIANTLGSTLDEGINQFERLLVRGHLPSKLTEPDCTHRLRHLAHQARVTWEESGAHTLYLAVGFLRWSQGNKGNSASSFLAPLALCPVTLGLDRIRGGYRLSWTGDDMVPNVTLFEKLRRDHDVELAGVAQWLTGDEGPDLARYFRHIRQSIKRLEQWEVLEESHLGLYSFSKFLMWRDLADNRSALLQNAVVWQIASPDGDRPAVPDVQTPPDPEEILCVLDADSSQLEAIRAALTGESFVLQGPPGTGKSQTITNMIAALLGDGKRVLFVSEKMAALQVVYKRLCNIGLEDFCLNLHHQGSNKKTFYQSLKATYQRAERVGQVPWEESIAERRTLTGTLNQVHRALHQPTRTGFSVHEALLRRIQLEQVAVLGGTFAGIEHWDAARWLETLRLVAAFFERARDVWPIATNPWRGFKPGAWHAPVRFELENLLERIQMLVTTLTTIETRCWELLDQTDTPTRPIIRAGVILAGQLAQGAIPTGACNPAWPEWRARGEAFVRLDEEVSQCRAALLRDWPITLTSLDEGNLLARFKRGQKAPTWLHWLTLRGVRRTLDALKPGASLRDDDRLDVLIRLQTLRARTQQLDDMRGGLWAILELAPDAAHDTFTRHFHAVCEALTPHEGLGEWAFAIARAVADKRAGNGKHWHELCEGLKLYQQSDHEWMELTTRLRVILGLGDGNDWPSPEPANPREALLAIAERLTPALSGMQAWCFYQQTCQELAQSGLGWLVAAHVDSRLPNTFQPECVERGMLDAWLKGQLAENAVLAGFYGPEFERVAQRFAACDANMLMLARRWIIAQLEARLPQARQDVAERSEPGLLMREAAKKTRQMPLRMGLSKMPHLIARLKPCFLMSPLSVAQYLPAGDTPFDVVIFDEASQIGTHDAIGAIARGRQVIIVGDSQQLPPTRFFHRKNDADALPDDCDVIELESILDEAVAKELPVRTLNWHYRSRHDDLIAFSNRYHYDNRLQIFPPAARHVGDRGVKWHHVPEGVYLGKHADEEAEAGTNPSEAAALVTHLLDALRQTPPGQRSFGVVTFNLAQQMLILELLEEARANDPSLEGHFRGPEALLVKNLENVQGDERDVVYFSVCYAPDRRGRMRMAFGPLGMSGGERRLNVAITRARDALHVFSSIDAQAIDLNRAGSVGARHLKAFLRFAAACTQASEQPPPASESAHPLIASLQDALQQAGYLVDTAVGTGQYRMALAIRHPKRPGSYALGIEVDAPPTMDVLPCRDHERIRPTLLAALGWKRQRVLALSWWLDRNGQWQRLTRALDEALIEAHDAHLADTDTAAPALVVEDTLPASETASTSHQRPEPPIKAYARYVWPTPGQPILPLATIDAAEWQGLICDVVHLEGPIPDKLLSKRVAELFQLPRVTEALTKRIQSAIAALLEADRIQHHEQIYWSPTLPPRSMTRCRVGERDAGFWVAEELALLLEWVLNHNVAVTPEVATKEVARLMGLHRPNRQAVEAVQKAMGVLLTRGAAHLGDDGQWVGQSRS